MGNEESQPGGGAPAGQQGAPGGFGMGPPQGQQIPRFGVAAGPPPPGMRQVAPTTGRPNLRPGGPGPPQPAAMSGGMMMRGAAPPPRQPGVGGPPRPVQVGVQPWAEPPVQQPPHTRGPAPQSAQPLRPQAQQQQKTRQQQQLMKEAEMDVGVDMSNLSEEEKAKILSVMARAQDLDHDYERHKRAKEEPSEVRPPLLCPSCQAVDLAVETNKMCGDCGKNFCQKCGTFVPGEGRRSVWVCNACSNRRKQLSAASQQQQQDTATYTMAGQKVLGDPNARKDETMSRMGQPFQTPQQQQQASGLIMQQQPQQALQPQVQAMSQQQQTPSVSLLGGAAAGGSLLSGSLIPSSVVGRGGAGGSIPRTVPLTAVSQQQWQPGAGQWSIQQAPMQQQPVLQGQQQLAMQPQQKQLQPQGMEEMTAAQQHQQQQVMGGVLQKKAGGMESSDWSPVTDLSPILDVSPSLEAAEQELMEKCVQQEQLRPIPRAQSGTISSLLADFNKSVGQTTPTLDDGAPQRTLGITPHTSTAPAMQKTSVVSAGGTEMDQNQNLVQHHQFQLQQQQLMIQQQQQVIQQQQQQLQQQMHQHQVQSQQIQHQQQQQVMMQQQDMQQQHAMTAINSGTQMQLQQQPNIVISGAPMQQHTQSQRKVHGRLPQPTVDQMQAAVALAAQTPRSKSQAPNRTPGIGAPFQRPVSPIMVASRAGHLDPTSSSSSLLGVHTQGLTAVSPTPRKEGESLPEGEGGKKVRRRLPPVPLDQEPTTVPLRRTKDRNRTLSMPLSTSADRGIWDTTRRMPQRTTSLDDGMSLSKEGPGSLLESLGLTSSSRDYFKLLAAKDLAGVLGTTGTCTATTTTTTSILDSIPSSVGLATSLLGRRDLSAPHSLSLYRDVLPSSTAASYLLDSSEPKLSSYIMSLKQSLREELRSATDPNRRRITDPDLSGLISHSAWTSDYDPLRKTSSGAAPLPSGSRMAATRRPRHRRHASDTKLSTFTSLDRDNLMDDPLSRYKLYQGGSSMPFKSYEFESIDDHLGPSYGYRSAAPVPYHRRSSLGEVLPDELRDTAVGSLTSKDPTLRRYNREIARLRRHTDTGLTPGLGLMGLDPYGRGPFRTGVSRSWHPSPYGSEDEDEREEKKAKIKAEIARRRQQLEASSRLHHTFDEPYTKARTRDLAGFSSPMWDRLYGSPVSLDGSDLISGQDEMLMMRRDGYRNPGYMASTYPAYRHSNRHASDMRGNAWPYDMYSDDLGDQYDAYSPLDSDPVAPMPLLPDMPTRSRRLLHDLGSLGPAPRHSTRSGINSQPYNEFEGRGVDDSRSRPSPRASNHRSSPVSGRKAQQPPAGPKYGFPVKRILLTRDPKDRSVSGNGLGMKVVGGKEIPGSNGEIGAYVARIYPGGVVETLGEVREGDQVLEWNGTSLTGKTYEEVQRIIATSGDEVEIVIRSDFSMLTPRSSSQQHHNRHHHHEQQHESRLPRSGGGHSHSRSGGSGSYSQHPSGQQQQQHSSYQSSKGYYSPYDDGHQHSNYMDSECLSSPSRNHPRIGSPTGKADTTDNKEKYRAENITGEIQLQVCYDSKASILYVTIVRARNLVTSRDNSGLPDPYVKCYLLPDRRVENQRRTRYFSRCSEPEWKQTMVYPQVPQDQLKKKHLEISVWNYDVARPPEFLGEVILDLKDPSVIDEQSRWYKLHPHDPKKYPSQSSASEDTGKMARLNKPALYLDGDDMRKQQHTA